MDDPPAYGRVIRDVAVRTARASRWRGIVEQKAATPDELAIREANMGIYCYRADLFWKHVDEIRPDNPAGEYYLTDMVEILNRAGHYVEAVQIDDPGEALGINDRVELAEVDAMLRERKRRELMLGGVTIEKPETVVIDADVRIGMDTVVEPFAQILGKTTIGADCRIGACSIVRDSELADGVEIGPFTIVGTSRLERGVHAGPFARLRMENLVEEGAHIGNFVELKKTRMGARAKANHLAYLGDAADRGGCEHWRGHHHLQLRRPAQARHEDRRRRVRREQLDFGGAHRDRRGRLRGRGLGGDGAGAARRAGAGPRAAGGEGRLGQEAQRAAQEVSAWGQALSPVPIFTVLSRPGARPHSGRRSDCTLSPPPPPARPYGSRSTRGSKPAGLESA